ncbi:P-loop containing nucleoside triphosphate hydrolase protein [Yamadazyma tenuis ATCC 10573]|uniref:ATP-dependent RNA helicase SUV3, mitochondrial n=2 Tax=Candida tenuis TaxID=2315449 RepID=G3AZY1_CANTC|nr:P-loop containing nucleoside triphosphate hydrolase protein [Yamadazyma tenuis ATCC 10573]EGV65271.1 P-loop containing nucleoside triphosphate hydrolase protein [Yamadazyma tenuis ATCC 10573]
MLSKLVHKLRSQQLLVTAEGISRSIDFSNPAQWYPETRKMKRKIVMHVGPTNSGKTYQSLKKLEKCSSGYYAGPLRLLAREIYENFNGRGINCNLVTGEEVVARVDDDGKISQITSGTIEMVPLFKKMDLCIIDEIQMLADDMRGEAWTSALLGVQAKEVHVCGEERSVDLVRRIATLTGDEIEINRYERLGKLEVASQPVRGLERLKPGDCVIAFSKRKILQLKVAIEKSTKLKVAVIYGALPPEIRSEQAHGFNSGKFDVLVASDAVGMGLNLAIKRIVFSTTQKFNGTSVASLTQSAVRQIGGRAGRFSHDKSKSGGVITAMNKKDLAYIKKHMDGPVEDIPKACVWPTNEVWTSYISKFHPNTSMESILKDIDNGPINSDNFFLTNIESRMGIMELLSADGIMQQLSIEDQLKLSIAPVNLNINSPLVLGTLIKYIRNLVETKSMSILTVDFLPLEILRSKPLRLSPVAESLQVLTVLEDTHKLVLLFMWLAQRWPYLFVDVESAHDWKSLIEKRIGEELSNMRESKRMKR